MIDLKRTRFAAANNFFFRFFDLPCELLRNGGLILVHGAGLPAAANQQHAGNQAEEGEQGFHRSAFCSVMARVPKR